MHHIFLSAYLIYTRRRIIDVPLNGAVYNQKPWVGYLIWAVLIFNLRNEFWKHCFCSLEDIPKKSINYGGIMEKSDCDIYFMYTHMCVCVCVFVKRISITIPLWYFHFIFIFSFICLDYETLSRTKLQPIHCLFETIHLLNSNSFIQKRIHDMRKIKQRREIKSFHFLLLSSAVGFFFLHS